MLTAIAAAVLIGKPFYPETRYVPQIEIIVSPDSSNPRERWESRVVVSELRHAAGERGYYLARYSRVVVCSVAAYAGPLPQVRLPAYRYHNGGWQLFPTGTFAAPGTFTLTLYAEIRWATWAAHCDEIRQGERPSYNGSWHSYPPPPECWTPSGFDRQTRLREVGVEVQEHPLAN